MFNHFFRIFFRTALKSGGYTFINITGLTISLVCGIFILIWVIDESSYDDFNIDKDRIYEVIGNHAYPDGTITDFSTPGPLANGLKDLPEIEESCRLLFFKGHILFNYKNQIIYEDGIHADPALFKIFTINILEGDHTNPIPDNNSIAISKKLAHKYFKEENAIGKILRLNNNLDAQVTAVFDDVPKNSSLRFEFVLPYEIHAKEDQYNLEWGAWTGGRTYVKLHKGSDKEKVNKKIAEQITKPRIWPHWDSNVTLFLLPLKDLRLHNNFVNGIQQGGRITYVIGFSIVAIFILIIACVNFMNLATARSLSRSKEIGVRKIVGANRSSLIKQFIGESVVISFFSLGIALLIVHLLFFEFNSLTGKQIGIDYTNPLVYGSLTGIALFTGFIAGSYPSFFLSSLKAIHVLKGKLPVLSGVGIRKGLIVFQFSISVVFIVSALVVYQQLEYMRNKNLGFDKANTFYFRTHEDTRKNSESFKTQALQNSIIDGVAQSNSNPMDIGSAIVLGDNAWPGKKKEDNIAFRLLQCDSDFIKGFNFTFIEGRNFSAEFPADSNNYIITEEAARRMHLTNPIGQELIAPSKGVIIGVVKDFHSTSLQGGIEPVIISMRPENTDLIFIRYQEGKAQEAIKFMESLHLKYEPNYPLEYQFTDEAFGKIYESEILMGKLSGLFTLMAIFISCLGLFGLASFTAERRVKEIGVRKVLGATAIQLVVLLCTDFVLLVGIALSIGLPIAWWAMQTFLSRYAFHTELSPSIFLLTSIIMIGIALITVSFQSIKTALRNPVRSLRTE